jgi:sortase A
MPTGRGIAIGALIILGALAVWLAFYALVLSGFEASRAQTIKYSQIREQLGLMTAPLGGAIQPGTPVAIISAPGIGVQDLVVSEGTSSGDLMSGAGHRRDTVLPGQSGVSVIYARGTMFGAYFSDLASAKVGSDISVTTGQGEFVYRISGVRVAGDPLPSPLSPGAGRLTLVSSTGGLAPSGVIYVDAALSGEAQPSVIGRPSSVPKAETAMQGDPSALFSLAVRLPLLIAALVFSLWLRTRWGAWQTWIVCVPLVMASLWLVSEAVVQLMPNLL